MDLTFSALNDHTGRRWQGLFERLWPAYRSWYLQDGVEARPSYFECRQALRTHMPELVPVWERLVDLAGGGDLPARLLSLYDPPAYLTGCSQAVWSGADPLLVRNYDYNSRAFDAVVLRSNWTDKAIMGTSDCLIGLVDGINDAGLAVSLTFGGRRVVGRGFGVPIILRYVLETCETVEQAGRVLARVPTHMAYNVTVLDAERKWLTVYLSPDRPPVITHAAVATNHQERVEWISHARQTATVERERYLLTRLALHEESEARFISAFLRPPLYSLAFERGFGTLYTAAMWPRRREMAYRWPSAEWRLNLNAFEESSMAVTYPKAA
ncbi:C45 family peptidase [Thalassobaculum sp.]|uniref:C45 family peptidase n=1 Tax=Thalassobaculum sp. TaxID=2022740 RepID=UPI0032ED5906